MERLIVLLILVALLVACSPIESATPRATNTQLVTISPSATNTPTVTCTVIASYLNVRAGPGVEYPVISYLVSGAVVPVYSRATNQDNGEWLLIAHVNPGWINARYCK